MMMEKMFFLHDIDGEADLPRKIYVEPTSMCNLNCSICFRRSWTGDQLGVMSSETFESLQSQITEMPSAREVLFGGMGEPLLHPEISRMVGALSAKKQVSLLTNGTMLTLECTRALVDAGLSELWISMDGFEKECYESIQIGSRFDRIQENINCFNAARAGSAIKLGITFVVTTENVEQLKIINRFADEVHADELNVSHMIPGTPVARSNTLYDRVDIPVGRMRRISSACNASVPHVCPFVSNGCTFVRWDGEVIPCMQLLHAGETYLYEEKRTISSFSYGNVRYGTLPEAWNDPQYVAFRQRVQTFYFPFCDVCWGCEDRKENLRDCFLGEAPTCGACLWATGKVFCP